MHTRETRRWFLGEFATPEKLIDAVRALRLRGSQGEALGEIDTYSPFPLHGAAEAIGLGKSKIPLLVLGGGLTGIVLAYLMQWWCNAVDYPINVGGRPLQSAPAFIPIVFEVGVLLASFGAFFGLWAILKLPRPHHPVFESERFRTANVDRFWLSLTVDEPAVDRDQLERELKELGASHVDVVEEVIG